MILPPRAPEHTDRAAWIVVGIIGTTESRWAFGLEAAIKKTKTPNVTDPLVLMFVANAISGWSFHWGTQIPH